MKKIAYILPPFLLVLFSGSAFAAGLVTCGDDATPCTLAGIGGVIQSAVKLVLEIAVLFIVVMVILTGIRFMTSKDKAAELNQAKTRLFNIVIGITLIAAAASVVIYEAFLSKLGVGQQFLEIFKIFKTSSLMLFDHAYAQGSQLPDPTNGNTIFGFLTLLIALVIRWFVIPVIIFSWFYTGFRFVAAQGAPEKLKEARQWFVWTVTGTIIVLLAQGFAYALMGTINQIFS